MLKTQIDDFDKRRFDSALRAKFITDCLTFNNSKMMENYIGKKCIVRCYGAGVFFGEVKEVSSDANGLNVRLGNARKVWYWDGAAAVEQLSQEGCNDSSKITVAVPELVVANAVQIIPCSDKAIANIEAKKNINALLKGLEVAFDETFNYAMCRVPEGMAERTEALQSYADDIVRLLILCYSRVDGDPQGNDKRQRVHRAIANFKAVPGFDAEALIRFFKMR